MSNMNRLDALKEKVERLYREKEDGHDQWVDWLYEHHVVIVVKYAKELAERFNVNAELAQVAALLHDIADYKMKRSDPKHEEESLATARQLMEECGYSAEDIALVVDDAIRFHSCHGAERPKSQEGLILATADSVAHLKTDFYVFATWALGRSRTLEETKEWTLQKLKRDFNNKISFDEVREEVRPDYELLKNFFAR